MFYKQNGVLSEKMLPKPLVLQLFCKHNKQKHIDTILVSNQWYFCAHEDVYWYEITTL